MSKAEAPEKSDLGVRAISAAVMISVASVAFFLGGTWLDAFIILIATAAFAEFVTLIWKATKARFYRIASIGAGAMYIGFAAWTLVNGYADQVLQIVGVVISIDVAAYFVGRKFGGPKIAPAISPSKTWSGLIGGAMGAAIFLVTYSQRYDTPMCRWYYNFADSFEAPLPPGVVKFDDRCHIWVPPIDLSLLWQALVGGFIIAVVAQSGDFFESWLKRRAGVKDSSNLIPGHGGVFDRTDGLISVSCLAGVFWAILWVVQ